MIEPAVKRTIVFIDGQNLFHQAKDAFGYRFPNYDVAALTREDCRPDGWQPAEMRFYTGIHDATANPFQNSFLINKTAQMGQIGIKVITRPLRYRNKSVRLPDGTEHTFLAAEEKGIDVRIALDVIAGLAAAYMTWGSSLAKTRSQDQDLAEVAAEIRTIAKE
ncbi:MAG: hypothetical protein ABR976_18895 [Terracidiphilus sp.]